MQFVGIDIASQTHVFAILDADGTVLVKPKPFPRRKPGAHQDRRHRRSQLGPLRSGKAPGRHDRLPGTGGFGPGQRDLSPLAVLPFNEQIRSLVTSQPPHHSNNPSQPRMVRRGHTEVSRHRGPWHTLEAVEFATLEWVDWFNHSRLLEPIGNSPPAEAEARYHAQTEGVAMAA